MSQTLTYVIGQDRRPHVDNVQDFKVNFDGSNTNWVQARQYERSMRQVFVNIKNEDGTPLDLTGCNVWFEGLLPKNSASDFRVIDDKGYVALDPTAGRFRFDMPGHAFTVAGSYRQAFFRILKDGNSITTLEFDLDVLADKVIDGLVPRTYISPVEELINEIEAKCQDSTDKLTKMTSDFVDKFTQSMNTLKALGATTQNGLDALEQKIKQDGLFTQAEADAFKQTIINMLDGYGLNVKHFGAIGDGKTDDTKAFQDTLAKAEEGPVKRVLIPDGTYLITKGLVVPDNVDVTGIGAERHTILSAQGISFLLEIGKCSNVTNFSMSSQNNGKDITLLKLGDDGRETSYCYVDKIYQRGSNQIKTYGVRSSTTNANIFSNTIKVKQEIMYDGLIFSANKTSWINGNDVEITTIGYAHSAVYFTSSEDYSLNIAQNKIIAHYEAIPEAEGPTYDANDIIGIRVEYGDRNRFDIRSWDDDGKSVKALSVYPLDTTKNLDNYRDNVFTGYTEANIITNFYTAHANDFSGLHITKWRDKVFNGDYAQLHAGNFNTPRNLISDDLIANMAQGHQVPIFASKDVGKIFASYDIYGPLIQCNSNKGELYVTLSGAEHNLIPGIGRLTVGFDILFDGQEDISAVTLKAGLSHFQSSGGSRMDSTVEKRDVSINTSMFGYRVVANVNVGEISAYDTHALTLYWDGLQEGHIKIRRCFIVPEYVNASQEVLLGRSSQRWVSQRLTSKVEKFQDMWFFPMPDSLVINPMAFDPSKLTTLTDGGLVTYPVYY